MTVNSPGSLSAASRSRFVNGLLNPYGTFSQLWKFTCVGAAATLIQFAVLIFLVRKFGTDPVTASVTGFLISVCFNYYLNYRITFRATGTHRKTAAMFATVHGVGLCLNACMMKFSIGVLHLAYLYAQVAATGCVFTWNFTANKLWTFRARAGQPVPREPD